MKFRKRMLQKRLFELVKHFCGALNLTGEQFRRWATSNGLYVEGFYGRVAPEVSDILALYDNRQLADIFYCGIGKTVVDYYVGENVRIHTPYLDVWSPWHRIPEGCSGQDALFLGASATLVAAMFDYLKHEAGIGPEGIRVRHSIAEIMQREGAGMSWQG